MNFQAGHQVIYVPDHAKGDTSHEDSEVGFVTSVRNNRIWCRFFHKGTTELRTKCNSQLCSADDLVQADTHDREFIDDLLTGIENQIRTSA